jgi:glucokinase
MTTANACYIGLDLGGTNIKAGATDGEGNVLARASIPTEVERGPDDVIERMVSMTRGVMAESQRSIEDYVGVGVGSPGPLSHRYGVVYKPANLPNWDNVPVNEFIRTRIGLPVVLENDANAALLGEYWVGAGKGIKDLVMFTLGTGVGGGVISDGRLLRGSFENAGELGHMIVQPGGRKCGCGQLGCLETYTSASYTARRATEAVKAGEASVLKQRLDAGQTIGCEHVERAALDGDPLAARIWDEAAYYLAVACVNVQHFVNAECVIFAGGMAAAGDRLLEPIRNHFNALSWNLIDDKPELRVAALGNDAGFIGAAAAVWLAKQHEEL